MGSFIWPYRRKLTLSCVFGLVAALLWSFELLLTFPITIMFGEYHTLGNYVRHEVELKTSAIAERNSKLLELDEKLLSLPENGERRRLSERVEVIEDQQRLRTEVKAYTSKLWWLTWIESKIIRNLPTDQFRMFALLFFGILVVTFAKGAAGYYQDVLAGSVAESVVIDLRQQLFRSALRLDPQTISLEGSSAWLTDFTYSLQHLVNGMTEVGGRIVREPLKALSCLVALFYFNWQLTVVFLLFMPVLGLLFHWLGQRLKRAANRVVDSMSRIYKSLEETFNNSKAVIAFDRAGQHRRHFHRENKNFYRQAMRLVQLDAMSGPLAELLGMVAASAVLLPAAFLVLRQTTTIGGITLASSPPTFPELALFYVLLAGVLEPVRKFSKFYNSIRQSTAIAERLFERMDTKSLVSTPAEPQFLPRLTQSIEFRNVSFEYARNPNDRSERGLVLNGLDLTIRAGETVAVVGPNGCGKSTLVNLLPRFYDPVSGDVFFDGINLKDANLGDIRDQIALVPQETLLFDDTILENIRYGRPTAMDADVVDAARRAHVISFSESMPLGLKTMVGEHGKHLSGGQRQRVALARAILRDPRILILDEPTSAVDAQSEQLIHATLRDFVVGRTTLLITHCLTPTLLEFLTRIVVVDRGRVVATGRHAELLANCPIYQRLWAAQTQRAVA
ncbi:MULTISPECIES: ABC transporter ATP-binding protein [unclassified Schlesneria]|uniref:ABC transporter ATP-binding protein n=1 Tax=Schlesneria TaxID=656899 RepID=UPI002EF30BBA